MKYIINKTSLDDAITKYIDDVFGKEIHMAIHLSNGKEVKGAYDFFTDDFHDGNDTDYLFMWTDAEYFVEHISNEEHRKELIDKSPIVEITETGMSKGNFDGLFGDRWKKPFVVWFKNKFNLPVNSLYTP